MTKTRTAQVRETKRIPAILASGGDQATSPREGSKAALLIGMLFQPEGASIDQMSEASGWMPHSVRGFMAGALRRKHGITVASAKDDGQPRIYRAANGTARK